MSIVEDSYYDHDRHGRVRVVLVEEDTVFMETTEIMDMGGGKIPTNRKQDVEEFSRETSPADFTVDAPATSIGAEQNKPQ